MLLAMIQDKIIEPRLLSHSHTDRGIFFGDGVYEVVRSYDGKLFALDLHLARFERSLKAIDINNVDIDDIRSRIELAFAKAQRDNCSIYFHITRGSGIRNHNWKEPIDWNFFLFVSDITGYEKLKEHGAKLCYYPDTRWKRCDIKSLNLLPNVLAKHYAEEKGCFDALLLDSRGDITECASSAFAAIYGNDILTRPLGNNILPSITRIFLSRAAVIAGLNVVEKILSPFDLQKADELFIAVTTKDIVGVVELEGKAISGGKTGKLTRRLQDAFMQLVKE